MRFSSNQVGPLNAGQGLGLGLGFRVEGLRGLGFRV